MTSVCLFLMLMMPVAAAPKEASERVQPTEATKPALTILDAQPDSAWDAVFAGKKGWVGGDGLYSAAIGSGRILWLFGDSFWGTVQGHRRVDCTMINNAVALQRGIEAASPIEFYTGSGGIQSFFRPTQGSGYFWPHAAVAWEEKVVVFLALIEQTPTGGPFGFRHAGECVAIIENPQAAPAQWRVTQTRIPFTRFAEGDTLSFGSAVCLEGDYLYVYGYRERGPELGTRELVTARVLARELLEFDRWQFWDGTAWNSEADAAKGTVAGMATELSVSPHLHRGHDGAEKKGTSTPAYLLIYTENGLGERILARTAPTPQGPWSQPVLVYEGKLMKEDKGCFCYGAKEHPWARTEGELLLSYCANDWEFERLFKDDRLYRPHFVRVKYEWTPRED